MIGLIILFMLAARVLIGRYGVAQVIPVLNLDMRQWLAFGCFFFFGALGLEIKKYLSFNAWIVLISLAGLFLFSDYRIGFYLMFPVLTYATLWLAALPLPRKITTITTKADFSYGVYIYAFVVGQMLVRGFGTALTVLTLAVSTTIVTLPIAALSWYFVEKPFLRLKNRLPNTAGITTKNLPLR